LALGSVPRQICTRQAENGDQHGTSCLLPTIVCAHARLCMHPPCAQACLLQEPAVPRSLLSALAARPGSIEKQDDADDDDEDDVMDFLEGKTGVGARSARSAGTFGNADEEDGDGQEEGEEEGGEAAEGEEEEEEDIDEDDEDNLEFLLGKSK
jgi:hypothetical protein